MSQPQPHLPADPEARARRLARLEAARLYVCTDARTDRNSPEDMRELEMFFHEAFAGGVDIIQLRDKSISARDEIAAVRLLGAVAREHGGLFAVNDRADIAALTNPDIFHGGQEDLCTADMRALLGPDVLLGRSNRSEEMFADSLADGDIDYAVIGPVWPTPTKPDRAAVGVPMVSRAAEMVAQRRQAGDTVNWWAIGGIDIERAQQVRAAGAERIVVVRAVTEAKDPRAAATALRAVFDENLA
ncbi:thiamine phosphate synthase [Corynebacterium sp. TAE3-ERU12]|uniref:thiamine phosphate synthase n=1 Tax=Corynebacterium sp. TAE3-ERU12 TaxID=2849491 RepID=UPI001C48BAEB|nr:thiamine phosphate synthase [Corynebacterium sp. TAE3-ERU12]MBV7295302.1 thiamine phosphate synthase [Corynebacterium sp. TAE3-ERU12]